MGKIALRELSETFWNLFLLLIEKNIGNEFITGNESKNGVEKFYVQLF